jgi:hypothetical protein
MRMVEVTIEGPNLVCTVIGLHKVWALRSRLEIPLAHVRDVHRDTSPKMGWFDGLKISGTNVPHLFRAGMFYQDGGWVFWDVRHRDGAIVLEMEDEEFKRLVVEVESPVETVEMLKRALAGTGATRPRTN